MDNSDNQPGTSRASEKRSVSPSADTTTNSTTQQQNKRLKSDGVENEMVVGTTVKTPDLSDDSDGFMSCEEDYDEELDDVSSDLEFSSSSITTVAEEAEPSVPSCTYDVLSIEEITREMNERIENARGVLQLPPTTVRALLNHCSWNKEKLLDAYFGGGDAKKLFEDAGIDSFSSQEKQSGSSSSTGGKEDCLICVSEMESGDMIGMNCGHKFCKDCWRTALKSNIMEQGKGAKITCIAHNCSTLVDDDFFRKLVTEVTVLKKFQELVVSSFVQTNPSFKWCPGPGCTKAIKIQTINEMNPQVKCDCCETFCFKCSGDAHAPLTCELLKKWVSKCRDTDTLDGNWIVSNTKPCPKCKVNIEKNGGCNHMSCTNSNCGYQFCWICLGEFKNHDPYRCNRFVDPDVQNSVAETRAKLERFMFYFNRFMSQQDSLKMERTLYGTIKEKMKDLVMSPVEMQFVKLATDALCECRQTLQHTYVFAYLVKSCNQMDIFVGNQNDLQAAVERLSGFMEEKKDWDGFLKVKTDMQNLTRYCQSRRQVLVGHVFEGYLKTENGGGWGFNQ